MKKIHGTASNNRKIDIKNSYGDMPIAFNGIKDFKIEENPITEKISKPFRNRMNGKKLFFETDLKNRTYFEDALIHRLIKEGYCITENIENSDYYLGYGDKPFLQMSRYKFKKAISFSTDIYPCLSLGIDDRPIRNMPLSKQLYSDLKKSQMDEIDRISNDVLIVHGQYEKKHLELQATFFYSSLKDRKPNLVSRLIVVPEMDEELYNHPSHKLMNNLFNQIMEFLNHE